jgi:uncharacterized protein YebE (UPF0316 family)
MLWIELIALFVTGIVFDAMTAVYFRAMADNHRAKATILSIVITLVSFIVCARIWENISNAQGMSSILAYSFGGGAGTWLGMRPGMPKPA